MKYHSGQDTTARVEQTLSDCFCSFRHPEGLLWGRALQNQITTFKPCMRRGSTSFINLKMSQWLFQVHKCRRTAGSANSSLWLLQSQWAKFHKVWSAGSPEILVFKTSDNRIKRYFYRLNWCCNSVIWLTSWSHLVKRPRNIPAERTFSWFEQIFSIVVDV